MFGIKKKGTPLDGQTKFRLVIDYNATSGGINVEGPISNQMICYGMLRMADMAISDYNKRGGKPTGEIK